MKIYRLCNIAAIFTKITKKCDEKRATKMLNKVYKKSGNVIGSRVPRSIK